MLFLSAFISLKQKKAYKLWLKGFVICVSLNSYAFSDKIPDQINKPQQIRTKTAEQIKAVFSSLEQIHKNKPANLWQLKYQKALLMKQKDKKFFCLWMQELGENPDFPLKKLALIQSYELCPYPPQLNFNPDLFPQWLRLRLAHAFYKRRKWFKNPEQTLKATIYLAKNSSYKELRISYLKHGLALAKEQKNDKETQALTKLLHKKSPSLNPKPQIKDYFLVAEDFRQNRKFKKAIAFYIKTLNSSQSSFDEKNLSFKGLNRIYNIQKNHKKTIINSKQWASWLLKKNTKQSLMKYYKRRLELARKEWNLNKNQKAIQLITKILREPKSQFIANEALYLRGLIYSQEKQWELSLRDWNQAIQSLTRQKHQGELLGKILWKKSWLLGNQKKYKKAIKSLTLLEKTTQNPYTKFKLLFWKGKNLQNLNRVFLAKRSFHKLIKKDPFGYYGLLARKTLNEKISFQERGKLSEELDSLIDQKSGVLIHWLILFEESELLSQFLEAQKNEFISQKKPTKKQWLKMAWLWFKAKKYLELFQSLESMDESVRLAFLTDYTHLLFPLDFSKEVGRASQRLKVSKALIFSIIRQESAFNPRARSPADAFGLMQLIPSTARQTAKKLKTPYRNFRDLYRPEKNVLLGTAYIKKLLRKYHNSFLLALSAYNAGPTAVNQWKKELKNFEPLEFIENIPYEETRTYIRLLIRNYVFYHNLLEEGEEWFPDRLLQ